MFGFAALSGYVAALAFALLSALLLVADQGHRIGRFLIVAALVSTIWFAAGGAYYAGHDVGVQVTGLAILELLRDASWFAFCAVLLHHPGDARANRSVRRVLVLAGTVIVLAAGLLCFGEQLPEAWLSSAHLRKLSILCFLAVSIFGLMLVERLIRLTRIEARWAIKHLSLGLVAIFAFDFYLYADALLFARLDPNIWAARGIVNALSVPLIALAAARNRAWNLNIFVSRRVVFHSFAALGSGIYLLLMSLAGYYLNSYGGTWGAALRAAFLSGAIMFLVTLIVSTQLRSRLRRFLAKHFYKNRYEYGEVWLSFTRKLSTSNADSGQLRRTILRAIADIVDSTGGVMWNATDAGTFAVTASWSLDGKPEWSLPGDHPFVQQLRDGQEIIELRESANGAVSFPWLAEMRRAWIAVPILHADELLAFLVLAEPRTNEAITWEDRDLLRTVGRQAASYLAFLRATEALTEARQFEAFNRLSAFLVHDLKNVVAQLSLVVRNAEKHRDNPEFINDAFTTIGDAVAKINRMLNNLRQDSESLDERPEKVELNQLIDHAVKLSSKSLPVPKFLRTNDAVYVAANYDRFASVLEHLIQNAQDATPDDGSVELQLRQSDAQVIIEIIDTGAGMDEEFIRTRLFRPFDTTKGKAGMGIGVYESRHIVQSLGGQLHVTSAPAKGTSIQISLPRLRVREHAEETAKPQGASA